MNLTLFVIPLVVAISSTGAKQCKQNPSYSCPDSETCCLLPPGEGVGCCPYQGATCCPDHTHCCPHGLSCDIKAGRCVGSSYQLLLIPLAKQMSQNKIKRHNVVDGGKVKGDLGSHAKKDLSQWNHLLSVFLEKKLCPDPSYSCEESETCCQLEGDLGYGCCPLGPDAVCCEDKEHCCPANTTCDVTGGTCTPNKY